MSLTRHPEGWLSVIVPDEAEAKAKAIRQERDRQYGNIYQERSTDERWVGDLGEIVFEKWLRHSGVNNHQWHQDNAAGKADFTLANGCSIGVKTVKRKVPPRTGYTAQVTARHANEPVDQFFFLTYEWQSKKMWLLGGLARDAFVAGARYYGPGEQVHANYQVRAGHEIYNADIGLLIAPDTWLEQVNRR